MGEKWSIIDIGSNTIRLVIYEYNHGGCRELENIKSVARLRHYLQEDKILDDKGCNLLIKILNGFRKIIEFHQVSEVLCVATATIRQAKNQAKIIKRVKKETGFDIKVLSEEKEAYYGYLAVSRTTPVTEGVTIDIGGGSTEVTYYKNRKLVHSYSFPFGVVSLKEQFIKGEQILEEEKEKLIKFIQSSFEKLPWLKDLNVPIVAIGGSARNIAQIDQGIKNYLLSSIHQYVMKPEDLLYIRSYLESMNISQLEKVEGLSKDRADIIIPAIEVFVQLIKYTGAKQFMLSRKGLRDGIYIHVHEKKDDYPKTEEIINKNINELIYDYGMDLNHTNNTARLAVEVFHQIKTFYRGNDSNLFIKELKRGARLYYIGKYIDQNASSQHTFYLLAHQSINGLEHRSRVKLALIASFKNNALLKQYVAPFSNWFGKEEMSDLRMAGAITKFAASLDASKRGIVNKIHAEIIGENQIQFVIYCKGDFFVEKYYAEKEVRQLEKALKQSIQLKFKLVNFM